MIPENHHPSGQNCATCLLSENQRLQREIAELKKHADDLLALVRAERLRVVV